ncbi:hypothetical protein [Streptomyces abyssalis]|nr:hypothetical protein [Streptomyces abyssalis]
MGARSTEVRRRPLALRHDYCPAMKGYYDGLVTGLDGSGHGGAHGAG